MAREPTAPPNSPLREIVQPFIDLVHAPRALWGINLGYLIEGLVYFGILGYLSLYFSDFVFRGVSNANELAQLNASVLTFGITFAMFFLGFVSDRIGVRTTLIVAFLLLLVGRILISAAPTILGMQPDGVWSTLHLTSLIGILIVVVGYGMYEPACYVGVKQFTTPKTAAMGYAMLYALMNLGGWLPTFAFLLRAEDFAGIGITGMFWVYTALTAVALLATWGLLSRRTVREAQATAEAETERLAAETSEEQVETDTPSTTIESGPPAWIRPHLWIAFLATAGMVLWKLSGTAALVSAGIALAVPIVATVVPLFRRWIVRHPLSDPRFFFFIFALIPVQTLFTYNWLVLPPYISRTYTGWIGKYFEIASNFNPLLIFLFVPIIAAVTTKVPVYRLMIIGTTVMALPAFLLAIEPAAWTLFGYIILMTVGEAMWQPRFLQYAAEIAPEGQTGQYVGVARLPWFLTKFLVPVLYSGWMMDRYCPADGPKDTETMWLIFALIAITTPILLVVAKGWMGSKLEQKSV